MTGPQPGAPVCKRCGTCCRKGGPSLHAADRDLVLDGILPLADLYTLRRGEMVHDNVRGGVQPAATDIIKIRDRETGGGCLYWDDAGRACGIYSHRPQECRALFCTDTRMIETIYAAQRLTREDLLAGVAGLWDLVESHQKTCDYAHIYALIRQMEQSVNGRVGSELAYLIRYDAEIRTLTAGRSRLPEAALEFLLGRPLTRTLAPFGIFRNKPAAGH